MPPGAVTPTLPRQLLPLPDHSLEEEICFNSQLSWGHLGYQSVTLAPKKGRSCSFPLFSFFLHLPKVPVTPDLMVNH